ncbi:hypothetical protein GCM10020331_079540 [Ectobacillus funiculus]
MAVLAKGGLNFDAKVRRGSFEPEDLFHAHIAGMDAFAIGLKVANKLIEDKVLEDVIADRYSSFTEGIGLEIVEGRADFHKLEQYALSLGEIKNKSSRQERLKSSGKPIFIRNIIDCNCIKKQTMWEKVQVFCLASVDKHLTYKSYDAVKVILL